MDNYKECIEYYQSLKRKEVKKKKYLSKFALKEHHRLQNIDFLKKSFEDINEAFDYKNDVYTWMLAVEIMDISLSKIWFSKFAKNKCNFLCACISIAQKFNDVFQYTLTEIANEFGECNIEAVKAFEIKILFEGLSCNVRLVTMYEVYEIVIQILRFKIAEIDSIDELCQELIEMTYHKYHYLRIPNTLKVISIVIFAYQIIHKVTNLNLFFDCTFYSETGYSQKEIFSCIKKIKKDVNS